MSPFAYELKKLRAEKGLQQKIMADIIGCEPSYLSALETDAKVPPQKDKLLGFLKKLKLSEEEMSSLILAAEKSKRTLRLPFKGPSKLFEVCHALEGQLDRISDIQLELIDIALRLNSKNKP